MIFQFNRNSGKGNDETDLWIAYCAFNLGDYKRSMEVSIVSLKNIQQSIN